MYGTNTMARRPDGSARFGIRRTRCALPQQGAGRGVASGARAQASRSSPMDGSRIA